MKKEIAEKLNRILSDYNPSSYEYEICLDFLKYLDRTDNSHIISYGLNDSMQIIEEDFGYPHRYTEKYIKGRFAKLYLLDEWYKINSNLPITFLTMTSYHKADTMPTLEESLVRGIYDTFKRLQYGKKLYFRELRHMGHKSIPYIGVSEPHPESGYPHTHVIIFDTFTHEERNHLHALWETWGIGSGFNGLKFDERPDKDNIKSLRNYLMKYMSKSFVDYSSKYQESLWSKEQLLFNAVAWKYHFRTWFASNGLSKVMAYHPDNSEDIDWYKTVLSSPDIEEFELWKAEDVKKQVLNDKIDEFNKAINTFGF